MATVELRPMEKGERGAVLRFVWSQLQPLKALFFFFGRYTLLAVDDQRIVGVITYKDFTLGGGQRGGILSWAVVARARRGEGIGRRLYDAASEHLVELGVDDLFGSIEGLNTPSSRLLASRGYVRLSFMQQLRRYGARFPLLWIRTTHTVDLGHFLWVRRADGKPLPGAQTREGSEALAWWGNLLATTLLLLAIQWRNNPTTGPSAAAYWIIPAAFLVIYGSRELGMRLAARLSGLALRFRPWESGYGLGALIALFSGWPLPLQGNLYPRKDDGASRQQWARRLGPVALTGTVTLIGALLAARQLQPLLPAELAAVARWSWRFGKDVLLFDVLLPFFPFIAYNGRRLWEWHPLIWLLCAGATLLLHWL